MTMFLLAGGTARARDPLPCRQARRGVYGSSSGLSLEGASALREPSVAPLLSQAPLEDGVVDLLDGTVAPRLNAPVQPPRFYCQVAYTRTTRGHQGTTEVNRC